MSSFISPHLLIFQCELCPQTLHLENLSEQVSDQVIDNPDVNIDIATDELSEQNSNQIVVDDNVYSRRGRPIKKPLKLDL